MCWRHSVLAPQPRSSLRLWVPYEASPLRLLVRQAWAEGHTVHNHSYSDTRLTAIPWGQARQEIDACSLVLKRATGVYPRFLRCPGGHSDATVREYAQAQGMICCDDLVTNLFDMDVSAEVIAQRCRERVHPGAILSIHDGVPATLRALPEMIADLRREGYSFATVEELLSANWAGGGPPAGAGQTRGEAGRR